MSSWSSSTTRCLRSPGVRTLRLRLDALYIRQASPTWSLLAWWRMAAPDKSDWFQKDKKTLNTCHLVYSYLSFPPSYTLLSAIRDHLEIIPAVPLISNFSASFHLFLDFFSENFETRRAKWYDRQKYLINNLTLFICVCLYWPFSLYVYFIKDFYRDI